MLPAQQCLEAENFSVDGRLRLIVQPQLAVGDRRAQIVLQRVALSQMAIHFRMEETGDVAPIRLCPIQRSVGIGLQRHGISGVLWIKRGADAQAHRNSLAADFEIHRQRLEQAVGQGFGGSRLFAFGKHQREFIAADAGDECALRRGLQAPGNGAQKLIADRMPEHVVGFLEMIEIDVEHGKTGAPRFRGLKRLRQFCRKHGAVGQVREWIVMGEMGDLCVLDRQLVARRVHVSRALHEGRSRPPSPLPA